MTRFDWPAHMAACKQAEFAYKQRLGSGGGVIRKQSDYAPMDSADHAERSCLMLDVALNEACDTLDRVTASLKPSGYASIEDTF